MKKVLKGILCAALCGAAILGAAACGNNNDNGHDNRMTYSVYAPDGAPALALANLIDGEKNPDGTYVYDVHIVDANTIQTYVTGNDPKADLCVLPSNAAGTLLGSGDVYQMLGTVTNGNLYFLTDTQKDLPALTPQNLSEALLGKTLGVIQYDNVPGLTLRVVLQQYEIPFTLVENNDNPDPEKVNLRPLASGTQVAPSTGCDYYLCPEPARTTKIGATASSPDPLRAAGSLQELYDAENGYPQAVLVAKKSFLQNSDAVSRVIGYMEGSAAYLQTADAATLNTLLQSKRTEGMEAAFTESQLNKTVLKNCSVRFTKAADCKTAVIEFLTKFRSVNENVKVPADAFFYAG